MMKNSKIFATESLVWLWNLMSEQNTETSGKLIKPDLMPMVTPGLPDMNSQQVCSTDMLFLLAWDTVLSSHGKEIGSLKRNLIEP